jgi:hypothetical protein
MNGGNPTRRPAVEPITSTQLLETKPLEQVGTPMTPIAAEPSAYGPSSQSEEGHADPTVERGRRAGMAWATGPAEYFELKRLAAARDRLAFSTGDGLREILGIISSGRDALARAEINDFRDVLVLAGAAAASAAFWSGFVEGAIAVFYEIAI